MGRNCKKIETPSVLETNMAEKWAGFLTVGGLIFILAFFLLASTGVGEEHDSYETVSNGYEGQFETRDPPRDWIHVFAESWFSCEGNDRKISFTIVNSSGDSAVPEDWVCSNSKPGSLLMEIKLNGIQDSFTYTSSHEVTIYTADIQAIEVNEHLDDSSFYAGIACYMLCCSIPIIIFGIISAFKSQKGKTVTYSTPGVVTSGTSEEYSKTSSGFYMPAPPPKIVQQTESDENNPAVKGSEIEPAPEPSQPSVPWENIEELNE